MVFCNELYYSTKQKPRYSHNPYFNRWFSAIKNIKYDTLFDTTVTILILIDGFLQSRRGVYDGFKRIVTILILIDGFLQSIIFSLLNFPLFVTILILIDGFLQ